MILYKSSIVKDKEMQAGICEGTQNYHALHLPIAKEKWDKAGP
jgi:hypothetical protein